MTSTNPYRPADDRYEAMPFNRCGRSGIKLPPVSLGLWHNFGGVDDFENARAMLFRAFDLGITHFDLANNYGPPYGSAEETFGRVMREDLRRYRDEMIISTKAGWDMWPGPYGDLGSRKYLLASLDQSLQRMGLEYVDIFYHHRPDPETPLAETMGALDAVVRQGKALYAGISSYDAEQTKRAAAILKKLGTPCLIHQPKYSMFERWIEDGLTDVLEREGIGCIAFSPLAQGLLTDKYLTGIPPECDNTSRTFVLKVDADRVKFSNPRPLASTLNNELAVECTINISDGAGMQSSGVDASTIEYSVSTNGGTTWGPWTSAGLNGIYQSLDVKVTPTFANSFRNLIKWRATDAVGNDLRYSEEYKIVVDTSYSTSAPTSTLLTPASGYEHISTRPVFVWTGTDPEDDAITYDLCVYPRASFLCMFIIFQHDDTGSF